MNSFEKDLEKLCRNNKHIYIYGAGLYARNMYKILDSYKVEIEGFLVTSKETDEELFGLPVIESKSIINSDIGLVIGLGKENTLSVLEYLKDMGFCMDNVVVNKDFFRSGENGKYIKKRPLLEITTVIGCKVACEYCPQKTLISAYGTSDRILSLESFKFILEKIPANCDISFGGMAEPFLNPMCIDMIEEASKQHRIEVMTTLVGMDDNTFKRFLESQVSYLVLHVADKNNYAKINKTEQYYNRLQVILNHYKEDGTRFVNLCSAQDEPDERVVNLCRGKVDILTALHDRAGNLEGDALMRRKLKTGSLTCSMCGDRLDRNVLLPDGRIVLCCNDYAMQHVLGNIFESSYEDILDGEEINRVKDEMKKDYSDVLCRSCQAAILCDKEM